MSQTWLASHARRSVFGPATLALVILAALFVFLPQTMAYLFGALCIWLAASFGREALRRRADR